MFSPAKVSKLVHEAVRKGSMRVWRLKKSRRTPKERQTEHEVIKILFYSLDITTVEPLLYRKFRPKIMEGEVIFKEFKGIEAIQVNHFPC